MEGNKVVLKTLDGQINQLLEEQAGVMYRVRKSEDGDILIEAIDLACNYKKPYIPEGFEYVQGAWNDGFTIRNKVDGSLFVWVPVGSLEADGTLDGENFNQKFGRRKFKDWIFSNQRYHEPVNEQLVASIKQYGGFYISAFVAHNEGRKPVFKKDETPWINISEYYAEEIAKNYAKGGNPNICSCLPSGSVYDTIFKWIIQTNAKTFDEVVNNSSSWGNFLDSENSPRKMMPTGSCECYKVYNIYGLAGNCSELTTELFGTSNIVRRGGSFFYSGSKNNCSTARPAVIRDYIEPIYGDFNTSFRVVVYKKLSN